MRALIAASFTDGYWLKEKTFRKIRKRIRDTALETDLTRLYYTGQFEQYARRIAGAGEIIFIFL
jgi:hypothetical protein